LRIMSHRDKIICLFDVDGTLTAPMKVSFMIVTRSIYLGVPSKINDLLGLSKNVEHNQVQQDQIKVYLSRKKHCGIKYRSEVCHSGRDLTVFCNLILTCC
jgi:hypothetical protein